MSPSGPNQGEQLGQGELFYKAELLVIPLYTNSNTDKLTMGLHPLTHTNMSYLSDIDKLMEGFGFEEIVIEAGLCASGTTKSLVASTLHRPF